MKPQLAVVVSGFPRRSETFMLGELLALDRTGDRARVRELAGERLAALDARIAELEASRTALERLRATCAGGRRGPCPILEAFDGA